MANNPTLTWLGATYGLMGPGWQASYRITGGGEPGVVVVLLSESETAAIAAHLGQTKLEKRQAELILMHGGRELIEAALDAHEVPEQVEVRTTAATRAGDLRRWRVGR